MTTYEEMTNTINSFTNSCIEFEKNGTVQQGCRGMIDGATHVRDRLTIEAASCETR
jgi:hypothetical protein